MPHKMHKITTLAFSRPRSALPLPQYFGRQRRQKKQTKVSPPFAEKRVVAGKTDNNSRKGTLPKKTTNLLLLLSYYNIWSAVRITIFFACF